MEKQRGKHGGEDRIGADDQRADAGGDGLQAGVAEPEIERVVGDAENGENRDIAPGQRPCLAAQRGNAEDQNARQ